MINSPFPDEKWYLYNTNRGSIVLKHLYRPGLTVLCPHCHKPLIVNKYFARCCQHTFKCSFGEIAQVDAIGGHNKTITGWRSLRPYEGKEINAKK